MTKHRPRFTNSKHNRPWEHGSEFAEVGHLRHCAGSLRPSGAVSFYSSGRDAFRALVEHGQGSHGWRRAWVPSYLCQEVVRAIGETGVEVVAYADSPTQPSDLCFAEKLGDADVVVLVNTFGLRTHRQLRTRQPRNVHVVEDHTHDPWSAWARASTADYALVSYRKTLPVPDGSVVWSPRGLALPPPVATTPERERAAYRKLAGMLLKRLYLNGHAIEKQTFRDLLTSGEAEIAAGPVSGGTEVSRQMLATFPYELWREQRKANFGFMESRLRGTPWLEVLLPEDDSCVPFSCVVVLDTAGRRDRLRAALIKQNIYPAILWPLDRPAVAGIPAEHVALSDRVLSFHCDFRYTETDRGRVADAIVEAGGD